MMTAEATDRLTRLKACANREERLLVLPVLTPVQLEVLVQMTHAVWDGYVISKIARSYLVEAGLVERWNGWNFITQYGMVVLDTLKMLPTKYTSKDG